MNNTESSNPQTSHFFYRAPEVQLSAIMVKNTQALSLVSQIIEKNEYDDAKYRITNEGRDIGGESWNVFHLKALRQLLEEISQISERA
jgi:hypothetical protein